MPGYAIPTLSKVAQTVPPQIATTTVTGISVDTLGHDAVEGILSVGEWTDGTHTPAYMESDDDSNWSAIAAANMNGAPTAISDATKDGYIYRTILKPTKRYVKLNINITGSPSTGCSYSGAIVLGLPANAGPTVHSFVKPA